MKKIFTTILVSLLFIVVNADDLSAQKYEVTGTISSITQATEITLSGSTADKIYYLFRVDEDENYQYVRAQVGVGVPLNFGSDFESTGTYVVLEFDEFKGLPFDLDKYNPSDGILQDGSVTIDAEKSNN